MTKSARRRRIPRARVARLRNRQSRTTLFSIWGKCINLAGASILILCRPSSARYPAQTLARPYLSPAAHSEDRELGKSSQGSSRSRTITSLSCSRDCFEYRLEVRDRFPIGTGVLPMKYVLSLVAVASMFVFSTDAKAGLLDRMLGRGGDCCAPTCCEATCAAAEPTCAAAPTCAAPTCAAEPTCAADPSCGCAPACDSGCGTKCCRPTPVRDFLANLHCRIHSLCQRNKCCDSGCGNGCAEPSCAIADPACGCAR